MSATTDVKMREENCRLQSDTPPQPTTATSGDNSTACGGAPTKFRKFKLKKQCILQQPRCQWIPTIVEPIVSRPSVRSLATRFY